MSPEPKGGGGGGGVGGFVLLRTHSITYPVTIREKGGTLHAAIILITTSVAVRGARNKVIQNVDVCN